MTEIVYENGSYWVAATTRPDSYTVYKAGFTHSTPDSSYHFDADGLSIAKARCDYLAERDRRKAVDDAISRSRKPIGKRESKLIHALLAGR